MSDTTLDTLESIRESITQEISQAVNSKIASEFHELRTHLQTALGEFASQSDLEMIMEKAVSTAAGVAAGVASDSVRALRESQDIHQEEQRQKVQTFINEMRERMDTFATVAQVDGLRTTMEDTHRHFESITGAHGEALDTLKIRVDKLETSTEKNITAIRADTRTIKDNAQKTSQAVINLIKENQKREKEVNRELENLKDTQDADVKNLRRVEAEQRTLDMIIRDVDGRVQVTMTRIEMVLEDVKAKTAGLVADVAKLTKDLRLPSMLFGTKWWRGIGVPAIYLFTMYWLHHPELFAHLNPFSR